MLAPRKALQVVVPRPGIPADVDIALVGGGDIEGAIVKSGGLGFEGLDLELVDAAGKVVATARTDFDGFFLFERVALRPLHAAHRRGLGRGRGRRRRISAAESTITRRQGDRPAGLDPRRAASADRLRPQ